MQYDLTNREPLRALSITPPAALRDDSDYTQLFHYLLSEFHRTLNSFTAVYGYHQRKVLIGVLLRVLCEYMPRVEPELIRGYPASLGQIEMLVAQTIVEAVARAA